MVSKKTQITPNPLSYITLSWLTPVLLVGKKNALVEEDLPELADKDKAEAINVKFDPYWKQLKEHFDDSSKPKPSLARSLFSILKLQIIAINLLAASALGVGLYSPYVLQQLIIFVDPTQNTEFLYNSGILIGSLLFGLQLVATTIAAVEQSIKRRITQVLRSAIIGAIYEKSLRLAPKSQMLFTEGKVMNLVNQDTVNLIKAPTSLVALWQIPLQIFLSIYFLYRLLGNSIWAGAITLGVFTGITTLFGPYSGAALQGWFQGADARIGIIREMLMNMKVVKYQTMQDYFKEKIMAARQLQEDSLNKFGVIMGISQGLGMLAPVLLSTISFVIYSQSNPMKASIIFPALNYFAMLLAPLMMLSWLVSDIPQAFISLKRIEDYLSSEELIDSIIRRDASDSTSALTLEKVTWRWEEPIAEDTPKVEDEKKANEELKTPDAFHLRNFNAVIPKGQLIGIVGATGSGKSSFFSGLIGESIQVSGEVTIYGKVAYCSQLAWIMSGSIEKNILFNLPLDEDKLQKVVEVSGLLSDLKLMSDGLKTMIGESGVNLSGGQKARLSLARALYSDADIYLLDDPMASLDAQVGHAVFKEAIQTYLSDKTVLLVTHQLHYLQYVDRVFVIADGQLVEDGGFTELNGRQGGVLNEMLSSYKFDDIEETESQKEKETSVEKETAKEDEGDDVSDDFFEKEDRNKGKIRMAVVTGYIQKLGYMWVVYFLAIYLLAVIGNVASPIFLSNWTKEAARVLQESGLELSADRNQFYMLAYSILSIMVGMSAMLLISPTVTAGVKTSTKYHNGALDSILHAPIQFFESNPVGRILNRFSTDVKGLDLNVGMVMINIALAAIAVLTTLLIICQASVFFIGLFLVLGVLYYTVYQVYQPSNLELKRLQSILRSPLDSHISETLGGISSIRAYSNEKKFIIQEQSLLNDSLSAEYLYGSIQIWLTYRLSLISALVTLALASLAAFYPNQDGGFASVIGLCLSYSSDLSEQILRLMVMLGLGEAEMNSIERMDHYNLNLPQEPRYILETDPTTAEWPTKGKIEFNQLELCYPSRPDYAVIKDLTLTIKEGENIGIVGRTGSGKSTLVTALFRMMEPTKGSISIDGKDISTLGVQTLRKSIQIIPQDPVLFKGTIRSNLDYRGQFSDDELWTSLEHCGLKDYVSELTDKLESEVTTNGENLSVGQRQLICLCRSILVKPKLLVMDEATASVDGESDKLIQKAIKHYFKDTTIISIAHRLNTIAEFDRVLVLDKGSLGEFDTPYELLNNPSSIFSELVDASGSSNAELIRQLAKQHHDEIHA